MCKLYNKVDGIAPIGNLDNGIIPAETKLTITVDELAQQLNVSGPRPTTWQGERTSTRRSGSGTG